MSVPMNESDCSRIQTVRYFFMNRRWVNPRMEAELNALRQGWESLCETSVVFKGQCQFDHLVKVITSYRDEWENRLKSRELNRRIRLEDRSAGASRSRPEGDEEGEENEKRPAKRSRRGSISTSVTSIGSDSSAPDGAVSSTLEGVADLLVYLSKQKAGETPPEAASISNTLGNTGALAASSHGAGLSSGAGASSADYQDPPTTRPSPFQEVLQRAGAGRLGSEAVGDGAGGIIMDSILSRLLLEEHVQMNRQLQQTNAQLVAALQCLCQQSLLTTPVPGLASPSSGLTHRMLNPQAGALTLERGPIEAQGGKGGVTTSVDRRQHFSEPLTDLRLGLSTFAGPRLETPAANLAASLLPLTPLPPHDQGGTQLDASHVQQRQHGSTSVHVNVPALPFGEDQSLSILRTVERALASANQQRVDILGGTGGVDALAGLLQQAGNAQPSAQSHVQLSQAPVSAPLDRS